jgi:hydroxypyruvate isomerase
MSAELSNSMSRRTVLRSVAGAGAAAMLTNRSARAAESGPVATKGRIRQSLVHWCYKPAWPDVEELCQVAVRLGCQSIELIDPEHWPRMKDHGLTCAIASGGHGFKQGPNHRSNWDFCREQLTSRIQTAAAHGVKRVITFTGFAEGLSREEGADNCVAFFRELIKLAEDQDVTLCLEMLNTRDDTHPMKGHPGYQGDDTEYCIDIIRRVESPHFKLLFDIYHVQIMNGDVIRRLHQHKDALGHIHTAGNPGRGELDDRQEIHYPAVMQALVDIGYEGYVGQEFIPTRDAWEGLREAVARCDV